MRPSSLGNVGIVRQSPIIRESEIVDDGVACPIASSQQQQREDDKEYLFELAPLGTEDLLARCREGPGNWWGDVDDDSLRVDDRGRVVLVDPEMYFEHYYNQRNYIRIAVAALLSVATGRSLGRPSALTAPLVEHLSKVWHRPRRPVEGVDPRRSSGGRGGGGGDHPKGCCSDGAIAVALGRCVATVPLRPWANEANVMDPLSSPILAAGEGDTLHGQVLAWSEDATVLAVSLPTGGVACLSNSSDNHSQCLAIVPPRGGEPSKAQSRALPGTGVAGAALRGTQAGDGLMEVIVLYFDAVLTIHAFHARATGAGAGNQSNPTASAVCEQQLGRWHSSATAMAFHAATDTIAVAGPSPRTSRSGSTRSPSLSLTLWRVRGRASPLESDGSSGIGGETHARSRRLRGGGGEGGGAVSRGSARTAPKLMELHFVSLEGGSLVVPAPRAGLDRAPPGTVPALLPLLFPGLRAVAPPVQVVMNSSGERLAVLDLAGGVTLVELSGDSVNPSAIGRRSLSADGRSWHRNGVGVVHGGDRSSSASPVSTTTSTTVRGGKETPGAGAGAGAPRAVSIGWWSESTLAAMTSTGDLAFLGATDRPSHSAAAAEAELLPTVFQGDGAAGDRPAGGWPRPPPLGPGCTIWFAGDGRRAAVCWPRSGGSCGGGGGGGVMEERSLRDGVSLRGRGGVFALGLLSLGTAEEAVAGRVRRGLLGEALDLAVACGVDAGGVRAALWRRTVGGGSSFTEKDVAEHLVGASDHRWVVQEALSVIALAATEKAALALLAEGLRRCDLLDAVPTATYVGGGKTDRLTATRASRRQEARATAAPPRSYPDVVTSNSGDGWDFDDDDVELSEDNSEMGRGVTADCGGGLAGSAAILAGESGDVRVGLLRARLKALCYLLETSSLAENAQGRGFEAGRLRAFLLVEAGQEAIEGRRWEEAACRREVLCGCLKRCAERGEASALEVLFERHPLETLPLRLETLSALPETLDPASYARLLPCCAPAPPAGNVPSPGLGNPSCSPDAQLHIDRPIFYGMEAHHGSRGDVTVEAFDLSGTPEESPASEEALAVAAAATRQRDPCVLAEWYCERARELDARAGQLRYASVMCELGAARVFVGDDGAGGDDFDAERVFEVGDRQAVVELLRLRSLLRHMCSLVYSGRLSPTTSLEEWEDMGLEQRLTAVVTASSAESIADDVRAFSRAAFAMFPARYSHEPTAGSSLVHDLEGVLVGVLGAMVKASHSVEAMEACAAVGKASRPEVPEDERLIRSPEALLTLLLEACYAWSETAPPPKALEAAWDLLECVPARRLDVDASLQDRADALEGHLYATLVLQRYGLAPPLTRYLEMGGGAIGTPSRNEETYKAFARRLVDQMCAMVIERAGLGWDTRIDGGDGDGFSGTDRVGKKRATVGQIWRQGKQLVGVGFGNPGMAGRKGEGGGVLDEEAKEGISQLYKDVLQLQKNAWQGLGDRWAMKRVLQAVVEAGQFAVAKALVVASSSDTSSDEELREKRAIAENVLLAAATTQFNSASSFEGGEELWASRQWLDLLPWSSPALEHERRLHDAGRLAYDLGARDLVPLRLRLVLEDSAVDAERRLGSSSSRSGHGMGSRVIGVGSGEKTAGAMEIIREVLRCNPEAYGGRGTRGGGVDYDHDEGGRLAWKEEDSLHLDNTDGEISHDGFIIETPPGTALMRLAGLLGLAASDHDNDRVRALVARAALEGGDGSAACDILSAAILRRPPRERRVATSSRGEKGAIADASSTFAPELCEAIDLVVARRVEEDSTVWCGSGGGSDARDGSARTVEEVLCARALARCHASQIGRLLLPWSRLEATRYLFSTLQPVAASTKGAEDDEADGDDLTHSGDIGVSVSAEVSAAVEGALVGGGVIKASTVARVCQSIAAVIGGDSLPSPRCLPYSSPDVEGVAGGLADVEGRASGGKDYCAAGVEGRQHAAAEGALRLLLLSAHRPQSSPRVGIPPLVAQEGEEKDSAADRGGSYELKAAAADTVSMELCDPGVRRAIDRLCEYLAVAELSYGTLSARRAAVERSVGAQSGGQKRVAEGEDSDEYSGEISSVSGGGGGCNTWEAVTAQYFLEEMGEKSAEALGVGAVERGVGYALVAADGREVLRALKDLLEKAEDNLKVSREGRSHCGDDGIDRQGGGAVTVGEAAGQDAATTILGGEPPDESLVQALGRMGMPLNRARRACVATRNSSREAALAWCVDHASDPGIDLPYLPPRRPAVGIGSQRTNGVGGSIDSSSGGDSGEEGSAAWGANGRTAARARRMAADGLEAYVRARLTVLRRGEGGGGVREGSNGFETMKSERSAEARELTAVLTSFRKRQSVGEAEERASALLPAGVDLERFARDVGYRQTELERAATIAGCTSAVGGGKAVVNILTLAREHSDTDIRKVAAVAFEALLGPGYANLRSKGVPAATSAARTYAELTSSHAADGDDGGGRGLLSVVAGERRSEIGALQLARGVFMHSADGTDLHHLYVLLRVMSEAAVKSRGGGNTSGGGNISGGKNATERRLNAHCDLVRRLLKAAPPGLDYKRLVGEDPLADPLAEPRTPAAVALTIGKAAPSSDDSRSGQGGAGLASARARAMSELRSVSGLENALALSKLAPRIPGLTGSAVYLTMAQRVLCGETDGLLSDEALRLLRGDCNRLEACGREEAEVASASVYHLLEPLFEKMTAQDLADVAAAACAPTVAGPDRQGYYPCRAVRQIGLPGDESGSSSSSSFSSSLFPNKMKSLQLTVRCRRRILDTVSKKILVGNGEAATATVAAAIPTPSASVITERLTRLNNLLDALDAAAFIAERGEAAVIAAAEACSALEAAWAMTASGDSEITTATASAVDAAVNGAARVVRSGARPATVETLCFSMGAALGMVCGEESQRELDPSRLYERVTSHVLARLLGGDRSDRAVALRELRDIFSSVQPEMTESGSTTAWRIIQSALARFCHDGDLSGSLGADGKWPGDAAAVSVAPPASLVLWARAEVLTLLRSFGDEVLSSDARDQKAANFQGSNRGGGSDSGNVLDTTEIDLDSRGNDGQPPGESGRGGGGDVSVGPPSQSQLSIPFFRVAELAAEAFSAHVSPTDVESWRSRSAFLGTLVASLSDSAPGGLNVGVKDGGGAGPSQNAAVRRRLQATVDILGVWESEACEQQSFVSGSIPERAAVPSVPLSSAQRARRLRAEYAARALMGVSGGDGDGGGGDNCGAVSGSMSELLREWWPKLISVAAEARDWEFLSRCFVSGLCVAFTSETFEEALWSTMESSGVPTLIRLKVGLSSLHLSRHRAAAALVDENEDGVVNILDDEARHLALSSPSLPRLARTQVYRSLAYLAMRRKRCSSSYWPSSDSDFSPTSTAEFLVLAMACAGAHGRAAALVCETVGVHQGLRSLDGGLVVLGRWLIQEDRRVGAASSGDAEEIGSCEWFRPYVDGMRKRALEVFEGDVLT